MKQLILVGFMGAGKTTIGKLIGNELALEFLDLDDLIVKKIGMSIENYFAEYGEVAFRQEENNMLIKLMETPGIIATGGGIVLNSENRQLLKKADNVIYLKVSPEVALTRIERDQRAARPLVKGKKLADIASLLESRRAFYEEVADWTIETSALTETHVLQEIQKIRWGAK